MKNLFLKCKSCSVFLLLKDTEQVWYPSKLARASNSSYVHAVNFLSKLQKLGIVSCEKKGKQSIFRLTEKGAHLATLLDDFIKKCASFEQEAKVMQPAESQQKP